MKQCARPRRPEKSTLSIRWLAVALALMATRSVTVGAMPLYDDELTRLGVCYRSNDLQGSLTCLTRLEDVADPIRPPLTVLKARVLARLGNKDGAADVLEQLRAGNDLTAPGQVAATVLLASIYYDAGSYAKAIPLLQALLTSFPYHRQRYELRFQLADALEKAGRPKEALVEYLGLAESRLQKRPARLAFDRLYRQFLSESFPHDLTHEPWLRWGRLLLKKRQYVRALDAVVPMIEAGPESAPSTPATTATTGHGKRPSADRKKLRHAVAPMTVAQFAEALILGGEIELSRRNGWWARRLFLRASQQEVADDVKARALFLAGDAMYAIDLFDRAMQHYRQVLSRFPRTDHAPAALFKMAAVSKKQNEPARALAQLRSLVKRFPSSWFAGSVAWELGRDHYQAGRWRQAASAFADFCRVARRDRLVPTARYWQAKSLSHGGDGAGVRTALKTLLEWPLPGLYHLAAARYLDREAAGGFPAGLPMPRFDDYATSLKLLVKHVPPRPADGWLPLPDDCDSDDIERVALPRESALWEPLSEELERLVLLRPSSAVLRNDLAWAYERLGDFTGSIEQAEIIMEFDEPFAEIERGQVFDKLFPRPARLPFKTYCRDYDVPLPLAYAIAREESRFDPELLSWSGAKGVMQVMNPTGSWIAKTLKIKKFSPHDLYEPDLNVRMGCWYLAHLRKRFDGLRDAPLLVMAAYNAGPGNMSRWLKAFDGGGFGELVESWHLDETRFYVKKVGRSLLCYELLDGTFTK